MATEQSIAREIACRIRGWHEVSYEDWTHTILPKIRCCNCGYKYDIGHGYRSQSLAKGLPNVQWPA